MVEAREEPEVQVNQEAVRINICGVEKANALGLFREQELNTHVDVVLAQYIRVVQEVAQTDEDFNKDDFAANMETAGFNEPP